MKLSIAALSALIILIAIGCDDTMPPQRDLVLEVAASLGDQNDIRSMRADVLYGRYCSVCHGSTGKGDGFNAFNLNPKPRNFSDSSFVARLDTILILETIRSGGKAVGLSGLMPPWGRTLTEQDISDLAAHIVRMSADE